MTLLFSDLLNIILETSKNKKLTSGWLTQEIVVNSIFNYLEIKKLIDGKYVDYYMSPPSCSLYFQSKKSLPNWIRQELLSRNLDDLHNNLSQRLSTDPTLPLSSIVTKIRKMYLRKNFKPSPLQSDTIHLRQFFDIEQLEMWYGQKEFAQFLSAVILHCSLYTLNCQNAHHSDNSCRFLHFNEDVEEQIETDHYYYSYVRDVQIYPDSKLKQYRILIKRSYESPFPNPNHDEQDSFNYHHYFTTEQLCNRLKLVQLKINDVDYTQNVLISSFDLSKDFLSHPFKKEFKLINLPRQSRYKVELITEYYTDFPIRFETFKLSSPAKYFKINICICSKDKKKLALSLKQFGDFNKKVNHINKVEPNSTMSYFEFLDWVMPSSGYAYIVKPWKEYWKDFCPEN